MSEMDSTLNLKRQRNDSEKGIHSQLTRNENEKECNRGGTERTGKRRDALEDREEKKMNVGEEMLTKNCVSMQSEEDAKERTSRNAVRNEGKA